MDHNPGPGTYTDPSLFANSVDLRASDDGAPDQFAEVPGSVLSVTVSSDASGTATFQNLQDWQSLPVRGSENWTCS
jgi:hypothetical protein